jgi:hypothetical protein
MSRFLPHLPSLVLGIFIALALLLSPAAALADTSTGDVRVIRDADGVMYLSTDVERTPIQTEVVTLSDGTRIATISGRTVVVVDEAQPVIVRDEGVPPQPVDIVLPEGFFRSFSELFNGLLQLVFVIAALLVFFYLILGAFRWITSGGDKGKTQTAQSTIVAAVVGIIILAASYAILIIVLNFLGYASLEELINSANVN